MKPSIPLTLLCLFLATGQADVQAPPPRDAAKKPMVQDPSWVAAPGKTGHVLAKVTLAAISYSAFNDCIKCLAATDKTGLDQLLEQKLASEVTFGTSVLVIKTYKPERSSSVSSSSSAAKRIQSGVGGPAVFYPIEVRVLDGPLKGEIRFIAEENIGLLVPDPDAIVGVGRKKSKPTKKAAPAPAKEKSAPGELRPGDKIVIHDTLPGGTAWLAKSEDDHKAMVEAETFAQKAKAERKPGGNAPRLKLVTEGRLLPIKNDSQAKVKSVSETSVEIEVTAGVNKGIKGWIGKELVKPSR